jgi:hypothetical protein
VAAKQGHHVVVCIPNRTSCIRWVSAMVDERAPCVRLPAGSCWRAAVAAAAAVVGAAAPCAAAGLPGGARLRCVPGHWPRR